MGLEHPRAALALAVGGDDAAAQHAVETTAGLLRTRFPGAVGGQRQGLSVWVMAREPQAALLADCAASHDIVFGAAIASEDVPLGRAVEEAATAARVAADLDLGTIAPRVFDLPRVYAYAAMRSNPEALARSRETILGRLEQHPALLHTLRAYVETNRSVSATAARVHRHRQSVIYRLRRIGQLLEVDLDDAEAMFRVEAAVRSSPDPNDPGSG
jgi:DNA-binding PucR family transcriptional regulator